MIAKLNTDQLKESAFSRLNEADIFTKRFGTITKTEYELLMFTIYLDSFPNNKRLYDYEISQDLGITESKVRLLREKSQLMYPRKLNWQDLSEAIKHGRYNESDNTVTVTIEDPSCRNLLKYRIESASGTVDISLNKKQLRVPVECFIEIVLDENDEKTNKMILSEMNKVWLSKQENVEKITKESLRKRILPGGKATLEVISNITTIAANAASIVSALCMVVR